MVITEKRVLAHPAQRQFIHGCLSRFTEVTKSSTNILEVGSQDINGSIRDYFPANETKTWIGLDLGKGKGVDFTIPGELVQLPNGWADIAFSTECFEHAENWTSILTNIIRICRHEGLVILTFAGNGRPTHGTIDTDQYSSPFTSNYYKNISASDLLSSIELDKYFKKYGVEINNHDGDTYFWGIRNNSVDQTEWMPISDALARARGQLASVMERNKKLEKRMKMVQNPMLLVIVASRKCLRAITRWLN